MKKWWAAPPIDYSMYGDMLSLNLIEHLVDTNKNAAEFTLDSRNFYSLPSLRRMLKFFNFVKNFFFELPRVFFRTVFYKVLADLS